MSDRDKTPVEMWNAMETGALMVIVGLFCISGMISQLNQRNYWLMATFIILGPIGCWIGIVVLKRTWTEVSDNTEFTCELGEDADESNDRNKN